MTKGLIVDVARDDCTRDILPGSAILCRADDNGLPRVESHGKVEIWFEGNLNEAANLNRFIEKIACAAGRMVHDYPTTARDAVEPGNVMVLAEYDLRRNIVTRIVDAAAWRRMLEHPDLTYLAPPAPDGDVTDGAYIGAEAERIGTRYLPLKQTGQAGPWAFQLNDGRVLFQTGPTEGQLFWPDDPRIEQLRDLLDPETYVRIEPAPKGMTSALTM